VPTSSMQDSVLVQLTEAGIIAPELVRASSESEGFGDAEAVFRVGRLLLRVVRQRGQEFMDIGTSARSDQFHQFDDVEIAMGWKTIDELLAKREPEDLSQVLERVSQHLKELDEAFSGERERFTQARVEGAARDRGEAFMSRLRGKK
jgi:hypothetical protein